MASSIAPLLQPPPSDLTDQVTLRQWMLNIYAYLKYNKVGSVLLSNKIITTSSASIDFTTAFSGLFTAYKIVISDLFSVTSGGQPAIRFSTDGTTFDSTAAHYISQTLESNGATNTGATLSSTQFVLSGAQAMGTTIITGFSGEYLITNPLTTTGYCRISGMGSIAASSSSIYLEQMVGEYPIVGTTVKGFQVRGTAGNVRGTIKVYGIL